MAPPGFSTTPSLAYVDELDSLAPVHVRAQDFCDDHGAVRLLVVLQHGDHGTADRQAGAVQRVAVLGVAGARRAVADVGAAGLEGLAVGAGRDLAVLALAWEPDLDVVGLGGGEAHV